ncbi:MAG TPA: outer membrane beta-barrel protein, partial [Bryobacteraceae bacterium]
MNRLVIISSLFLTAAAFGQEGSPIAFSIGGGFTQPVGNTGRHLDDGWNVNGGIGFKFTPMVGVMADLGFNNFGINSATLTNVGFPDGTVRVFSATLDPIVHVTPHSPVDVYLIGGGGLYHRTQEFTQPTVVDTVGFDPFFG